MRVTMSMVCDILRGHYHVDEGLLYDPSITVSMACEYGGLGSSCKEAVYVTEGKSIDGAAALGALPGCSRVICVQDHGVALGRCALVVVSHASLEEVVDALEEGIYRYKAVLRRMSELAIGSGDVQAIVECAHELLDNPITVQDRAMRVKAKTLADIMDDDMWSPLDSSLDSFDSSGLPSGFLSFLEDIEEKKEMADYEMFNGVRLFACRTKELAGDFLIASLLQKNRELTNGDYDVVRYLCSLIEFAMKMNAGQCKEAIGYNGLLIDALEGRITSSVEFRNRMSALGIELKPLALVILCAPRKGQLNDRQAARLINDILNTFPFGRGVHHQGKLVFYATYDSMKQVKSVDFDRFDKFLEQYRMNAALSEVRPLSHSVESLYKSTLLTINVGRHMFPNRSLYHFEECQPYWVYETCLNKGDADLYIHPALETLRKHDAHYQGRLFFILRSLVGNRGNRSQTAKDLFIQRNTLLSRIREIELICKIDLSDSLQIDHLRRSFLLLDYCESSGLSCRGGEAE